MEEISSKIALLKENWSKVYQLSISNDAQWKAHLPYSSQTEINEVMSTLYNLLDRIRAPKGFEPNFHLAKGLALSTLAQSTSFLQNVAAGTWGHLPNFIASLNQLLACFHNMIVFSDKKQMRESIAELGDKLAQALALVDTAQTEMKNKIAVLERSEELAEQIEKNGEIIEEIKSNTETTLGEIKENSAETDNILLKLKAQEKEVLNLKKLLEDEINRNKELNDVITQQTEEIDKIIEKCESQQETISQLLPKGTSAGLAHSFGHRVSMLNRSRIIWMSLFIGSIVMLVGVGAWIFSSQPNTAVELWQRVLERLPLTAPLIWLGWFSAIQYGNIIRVQEDYAFKEATSKAFAGYKDHMEHLSSVNDESSKTALDLLSKKTIEILARSPLRIYRKSEDDVSFWRTFLNNNKKKEQTDKEE
ncbi:MAG: hypothetical protein ACOYU5_05665 [Stygiobacter sp.]